MPRLKPLAFTGSAELAEMIARVTPSIIELLADGVPRTKAAIVEALAGRHAEADAALALVRLAVTGQVEDTGGKDVLAAVDGLYPGGRSTVPGWLIGPCPAARLPTHPAGRPFS